MEFIQRREAKILRNFMKISDNSARISQKDPLLIHRPNYALFPFISSGMGWTRVDLHRPTDFLHYSGVKYLIAQITETELWRAV